MHLRKIQAKKKKQYIFLLSCGGALQPANLNTSMINIYKFNFQLLSSQNI